MRKAPYTDVDQRHLDANTPERAYWHHGYQAALNDVMTMLALENSEPLRRAALRVSPHPAALHPLSITASLTHLRPNSRKTRAFATPGT